MVQAQLKHCNPVSELLKSWGGGAPRGRSETSPGCGPLAGDCCEISGRLQGVCLGVLVGLQACHHPPACPRWSHMLALSAAEFTIENVFPSSSWSRKFMFVIPRRGYCSLVS